MIKCRNCGTELNDTDKFCVYCGAKQDRHEAKHDTENINNPIINDVVEDDKSNDDKEFREDDTDKFRFHKIFEKERPDENEDEDDEDTDEDDTCELEDDNDGRKPNSIIGKIKVIAIVCVTICVFIVAFKVSSSLLGKNSNKGTSNIESKQNVTSNSNNDNTNSQTSQDTDNNSSDSNSDNSGDYILPYSSKREVTSSDLKGLSQKQLLLASNEIFARHGYKFPKDPYKSYFESKSWYKVNPNYTNDINELSALERHNVKTILTAAGKHVAAGYDADYYKNK